MSGKRYIQEKVATGKATLTVVIVIVSAYWLIGGFSSITEATSSSNIWLKLTEALRGTLLRDIIGFALLCLAALQLVLLNNTFALIRTHTSFHVSLFLLFAGLLSPQTLDITSVLAPCMLLSLQNLFHTYQNNESMGYAYLCFFFMALGSLFFPPVLFFTPLFLGALMHYMALTPRTFVASILGLLTPYWVLFTYAFCTDRLDLFVRLWEKLIPKMPDYSVLSLTDELSLAYIWLITIVSGINCMQGNFYDKIRTRYHLGFLLLLQLCISVLIIAQPSDYNALFPLLFIVSGILAAHLFTLTHTKWCNLFFILCSLLFIALFGLKLWTDLSNS